MARVTNFFALTKKEAALSRSDRNINNTVQLFTTHSKGMPYLSCSSYWQQNESKFIFSLQ